MRTAAISLAMLLIGGAAVAQDQVWPLGKFRPDVSPAGQAIPTTRLLSSTGQWASLPVSKRPRLVNLWATWCGGCVLEMPTLAALQKAYGGKIDVVAVSIDDAAHRDKAQAFMAKYPGIVFMQDQEGRLARDLSPEVKAYPTTIVYDARGRKRARFTGKTTDWNAPEVHKLMDGLL